MEYTIKNTEINGDTTTTTVEYNIEGNIVTVDVAHFMATLESIELGINNRYFSEMYKIFPEIMPPAPVVEEIIDEIYQSVVEEEYISRLDQAIGETENYAGGE